MSPDESATTGEVRTVETPRGPGRLHLSPADDPIATLLLSHGAGGGVEARDLVALADFLPGQGISVARFEQPWRVAGRKVATAPPTLDEAFVAAAEALAPQRPLIVGGRSAGARSACRTARRLDALGVLALSFPLHPPGKPEKSRADELRGTGCTTLVIQGDRDTMGLPDEFPRDLNTLEFGVDFAFVPGADHGMKVLAKGPVSQDEALAVIVESALEWIVREVSGNRIDV